MKKCYFFDFLEILQDTGNGYHGYFPVKKHNKKKNTTYYGTAYILDKPIKKDLFKDFSNISFGNIKYTYAPEMQYNTVAIWENKLETINGEA